MVTSEELEVRCANCTVGGRILEESPGLKGIYKDKKTGEYRCNLGVDRCRELEEYKMLKNLHFKSNF